jgi:hypothetical protein
MVYSVENVVLSNFTQGPSQATPLRCWLAAVMLGLAGLALGGCSTGHELPSKLITFQFQTLDPEGGVEITMPISGLKYRCTLSQDLSIVDLDSVSIGVSQNVRCLVFQFDETGQRVLYRDSVLHQGLMLYMMVNGKPMGACMISQPIDDGQVVIFAEVPDDQLDKYVADLQDSVAKMKAMRK